MSYDPSKPVTIHNPLPQSEWPIQKNQAAIFLQRKYYGVIEGSGLITWYNPALETSCVVSKGHPTFTISSGISRRAEIVSVQDVFPATKTGFLMREKRKKEILLSQASQKREQAARCIVEAENLEKAAESV